MNRVTLPIVGMLVCGLSGCDTLRTTDAQAYSGARLPANQVAVLHPLISQILLVDDATMDEKCGAGRSCNVSLLPGTHTVQVQPMSLTGGGSPGYVGATSATPAMTISSSFHYFKIGDPMTIRYPFSAGHEYQLLPDKGGSTMLLFDKTTKQEVRAE